MLSPEGSWQVLYSIWWYHDASYRTLSATEEFKKCYHFCGAEFFLQTNSPDDFISVQGAYLTYPPF